MCILLIALNCHPSIPFICAHNRDEDRDRPSGDDVLEPVSGLVCGRDKLAGGIVLGLNSVSGDFAALTNCRTVVKKPACEVTSRGRLVEDLVLFGAEDLPNFFGSHSFDGFHIIAGNAFGDKPKMRYLWNCPADEPEDGLNVHWKSAWKEMTGPGVFVVSNENFAKEPGPDTKNPSVDVMGKGAWPKCQWLQRKATEFFQSLPADVKVEAIHQGIIELMDSFDVPELWPPKLPTPAVFPDVLEETLHSGPYAPWRPEFQHFGTVSQRVLISDSRSQEVSFFYRSTNIGWEGFPAQESPVKGPWSRIRIAWNAVLDDKDAVISRQAMSRL
mmetsp:Transcript_59215/g.125497  ORF Transcript_59215/g.125497 Transcript_59215/m.125497 type:complete len:329 (+) Transcript_59215:386-1372(+)|eukprot:CAMPEP_0206428544 /NCGR_PEP_ID=MMETSP0324_2-20121206/5733_1 /ASSEMBLY_ACC=CAM_ASM_000836 /TAXON_ID=2866 /ORGANISM="Crypthecodinium cohnii, Strain Seligo" /LENGTH=328 /DNA_ID=CAMNT_0053894103 /DNA_START=374 /DNA_END=1360 /DNA_ORIENTATION=+